MKRSRDPFGEEGPSWNEYFVRCYVPKRMLNNFLVNLRKSSSELWIEEVRWPYRKFICKEITWNGCMQIINELDCEEMNLHDEETDKSF